MSLVLFNVETGSRAAFVYESEIEARMALREANWQRGWSKISNSWNDGYECELCTNGFVTSYGPYAITELKRWQEKFAPLRTDDREYSTDVDF